MGERPFTVFKTRWTDYTMKVTMFLRIGRHPWWLVSWVSVSTERTSCLSQSSPRSDLWTRRYFCDIGRQNHSCAQHGHNGHNATDLTGHGTPRLSRDYPP
jgi:hypothetical protein